MSLVSRIARSNFAIKLRSWEYWPFGILQFPLFVYWLWLSLRARSLVFFSASNPGITMGGMFGESKYEVLMKIPAQLVPRTVRINVSSTAAQVLEILKSENIGFPLIFKPDLGERGFMVKRIYSEEDVTNYLQQIKLDFLAQELVDLPLEFGVFYSRLPENKTGKVTSVVIKEMLSVTGDGKSTLEDLILKKDRAKLQWRKLKEVYKKRLTEILPNGQVLELVPIGNHALGTKFMDGSHLINDRLHSTFDRISSQIEGFYFGRFDLRCATLEDLYIGNIKIVELNGCGAEPAHIYQPGYSFFSALQVLFIHWRTIFQISVQNNKRGTDYISLKEAVAFYKKFKAATK